MQKKTEKALNKLRNYLLVDLGDYRQTVFLAGTGRSGTTWVQEIINHGNKSRVMFEPFHSKKIPLLKGWNYRQYLRSDNRSNRFLKPATDILSGKVRHAWIDQYNRRQISQKRLIKDIRAQLLLKWIKANFPEIPIILLIRHPCAVANSKLKLGWDSHLGDFLAQKELMTDFLEPFKREIQASANAFDNHIFTWCIENYIPLKQFTSNDILVVFYETLCNNPQQEIENIYSFIRERHPTDLHGASVKPSALSRKDSAVTTGSDPITSWRKTISDNQICRAVEICEIFGLHAIYNETDLPLVTGREALDMFRDN